MLKFFHIAYLFYTMWRLLGRHMYLQDKYTLIWEICA